MPADMRVQLLIAGMNRTQYLTQVRRALALHHPDLYQARIEHHDTEHVGMARAVNTAWDIALEAPWDYLLHVEEDMLPLATWPIDQAAYVLGCNDAIANMVFKREPWSDEEYAAGDVIAASVAHATWSVGQLTHTSHDHIFSLNPCLIPRAIVQRGWPAGNEAEMTRALRADGYHFAFWGHAGDPALVRHIGHERGDGWQL